MSEEIDLGTDLDGNPLRLPLGVFDYHTQIIGPTGYGKTYLLQRIFQQLAERTDAAMIFVDPTGDAYHFLKRWCYERALDDRLVLIDPGETRLICGFNPIQPWPENRHLQASLALEIMRRAMGTEDFTKAPRMARWMFNTLYGLLETGLTMHEAASFLDYEDPTIREAITALLPPSSVRNDFLWLNRIMAGASQSTMVRVFDEHLGSSVNRFRHYTGNPNLRLMLATSRAIDWKRILDERKIVLVNLQKRVVLDEEHKKLLGLQIVNELIQEAFRREAGEEERVRCYLFIDEFQDFSAPRLADILYGGRKYLLRLILAHHDLAQLLDVETKDPKLYSAVLGCAQTKIVFGGLAPRDADEMGRTLYWHHLDPDKRQLEIWNWQQLSYVADATSFSTGTTQSVGRSRSAGRSHGKGKALAHGSSRSKGFSHASGGSSASSHGDSMSFGPDGDLILGSNDLFAMAIQDMVGYQEGEATSEVEGVSESESTAEGESDSESEATYEAETSCQMVVPGDPFEHLSSVQFEPLEVQLHRHVAAMIGRAKFEAVIAVGKGVPVEFKVARLEEPRIDPQQARELDLELMRSLPFYTEPHRIEEEILDRQRRILRAPALALPPPPDPVPLEWQPSDEPPAVAPAPRKPQERRSRSGPTKKTRKDPKTP